RGQQGQQDAGPCELAPCRRKTPDVHEVASLRSSVYLSGGAAPACCLRAACVLRAGLAGGIPAEK
ncbi:hypothetical protein, partial [Escherichia coli]|uniref:hypothetical protein n=1 Tax=Escherichia coli TaxID=562 RepID=UPI003B9FF55B